MVSIKVLVVLLLGVAFCHGYNFTASETNTIVVSTENGRVQGSYGERTSGAKKVLYWFRGIPFAEPPVGNLRFEAPQSKKKWSGILDVRKNQPECTQGSNPPKGSEDCLYLNIYTDMKPNRRNKLPVMVWIYGGGFFEGAADFDNHSPDYLLDQDVIVVGIHYRVGIFGFLSLGDTVAPGNNGIRDQILALKWIKQNIINFGGDPDRITVFGQSAGAASISYLLQIEETKGLFSRAIVQSGSSICAWGLAQKVPAITKKIADKLKVNTKNSANILAGLKAIDAETLQNTASSQMASELLGSNPLNGLVFGPVTEPNHANAIITGKSHELLTQGKFHQVPILIGYTSLEGYFDNYPALFRLWVGRYDLNSKLLVPDSMNVGSINTGILGGRIKRRYFGLLPAAVSHKRTMRFIADAAFEKPIQEAIRQYSKKNKVYAYRFSHIGSLWRQNRTNNEGVGHTEDLGYIFDFGRSGSAADYLTRSRMVQIWTDFAKTGNPTPKKTELLQNIQWPANEGSDNLKYCEIDTKLSITGLPNARNINFWRDQYRIYGKAPYATY